MQYFPIYYISNVISWNKVEQNAVKVYYSADIVINTHKYKVLIEQVQKT